MEPGEDPTALLDRLRRALGELTYDLTGTAEHLDEAEASFTRLRRRLETVRGVR